MTKLQMFHSSNVKVLFKEYRSLKISSLKKKKCLQRSTLLKASLCIFVLTLETPTPGQSLPPLTFKTSRYHLSLAQLPLLKKEKKKTLNLFKSIAAAAVSQRIFRGTQL